MKNTFFRNLFKIKRFTAIKVKLIYKVHAILRPKLKLVTKNGIINAFITLNSEYTPVSGDFT